MSIRELDESEKEIKDERFFLSGLILSCSQVLIAFSILQARSVCGPISFFHCFPLSPCRLLFASPFLHIRICALQMYVVTFLYHVLPISKILATTQCKQLSRGCSQSLIVFFVCKFYIFLYISTFLLNSFLSIAGLVKCISVLNIMQMRLACCDLGIIDIFVPII